MGKKRQRISTDGGEDLAATNPFAGLELNVKPGPTPPPSAKAGDAPAKKRETLLLRRLKSGRGGKVVTEISGFDAHPGYLDDLLKELQTRLGTGGTRKQKVLELQGECREKVRDLLIGKGYRVKGA